MLARTISLCPADPPGRPKLSPDEAARRRTARARQRLIDHPEAIKRNQRRYRVKCQIATCKRLILSRTQTLARLERELAKLQKAPKFAGRRQPSSRLAVG